MAIKFFFAVPLESDILLLVVAVVEEETAEAEQEDGQGLQEDHQEKQEEQEQDLQTPKTMNKFLSYYTA